MNFTDHLSKHSVFGIISQAARNLGLETYVIGGYVRDLILKRSSKDIDFVCIGNGMELAKEVIKNLPESQGLTVFKNFGTAMIKLPDLELEFVGARKESYKAHSRNPSVENGSLQDDQERRDFTINALGISLNQSTYGELVDPFGGIEDLRKRIIRTPADPNVTFSDDPLRMMRAIRFAAQLNFDIEADTFDGIVKNAERIDIVSQERITSELNKIIECAQPSYGFKLLFQANILHRIFPDMVKLHGVEKVDGKSHKDNFYHTLQVLDNVAMRSENLWLRWAAILHDIAKPATKRFNSKVGWTFHGHEDKGARMVPEIFKNLKLPLNEKMNYVQKLVRLHLRPIALVKTEITDSAVRRLLFEAGDEIDDLMQLCRADVTSKNHVRVQRYLENFDSVEKKLKDVEERDSLKNFQPPVTGEQIMKYFGMKPCKDVGTIKEMIKEAILDGIINNEEKEAFKYMISVGKKMGLEATVD